MNMTKWRKEMKREKITEIMALLIDMNDVDENSLYDEFEERFGVQYSQFEYMIKKMQKNNLLKE